MLYRFHWFGEKIQMVFLMYRYVFVMSMYNNNLCMYIFSIVSEIDIASTCSLGVPQLFHVYV